MARYTGAVCKLCRRERMKLFLKGAKCDTMRCPVERKPYPPGQHGRGRIRDSEYLLQLREKQKARRIYGVLEKQFRNMYAEAARERGITGETLLRMLELRLDNVVFRAGFSASRNQARQFVRHGHVNVNGKRVTIPSYEVKKDDVIEMAPKSQKMIVLRHNLDTIDRAVPMWLDATPVRLQGGRPRPAAPRADRRSCARTAHRRALLQVTPPNGRERLRPDQRRCPMLIIQRPQVEAAEPDGNLQQFTIGPLEPGFGHTLGNSLRRTLLSSIPGAAVTQVRFDEALHEFDVIPGVKEDVTDLILNIKDLVLQCSSEEPVTLRLDARGPGEVTAGDIQTTADVEVLNSELHLATVNAKGRLAIDLTVEQGRGYLSAERNKRTSTIGLIPVDAIFSPVRRVAFSVEPTRVEQATNYDKLTLEIETDGSISPRDALASAGDTLRNLVTLVAELTDEPRGLELGEIAPSTVSPDLDLAIEELELSERPRNCLKRARVDTIGQLVQKTEDDLLAITNFGSKSLEEVIQKLDERGLSLRVKE